MNLPPHDRDAPERTPANDPSPVRSAGKQAEERAAATRRRLAEQIVAGMLPETTSDERPRGSESGFSEQWYDENRPPHHG